MSTGPIPWAVVTGVAGAIGSEVARALMASGTGVVGLDRAPTVETLFESESYVGLSADLSDETQVVEAVRRLGPGRPLRHIIGIAGGALPVEPSSQHDPTLLSTNDFRASLEANLVTQFIVLRTFLPLLRAESVAEAGRTDSTFDRSITLTSSWNALTGCGMPAYSAAKAGLIGMMRSMVGPLGAEGIRINVVAPGTVDTPRTRRLWQHHDGHFGSLEAETALGRLPTPQEVAQVFLASTTMTAVTGEVLVVDSGQMVKRPAPPSHRRK